MLITISQASVPLVRREVRSVQGAVWIEALDYRIPPVVTATGIIPI